jgi:hypothetical protein
MPRLTSTWPTVVTWPVFRMRNPASVHRHGSRNSVGAASVVGDAAASNPEKSEPTEVELTTEVVLTCFCNGRGELGSKSDTLCVFVDAGSATAALAPPVVFPSNPYCDLCRERGAASGSTGKLGPSSSSDSALTDVGASKKNTRGLALLVAAFSFGAGGEGGASAKESSLPLSENMASKSDCRRATAASCSPAGVNVNTVVADDAASVFTCSRTKSHARCSQEAGKLAVPKGHKLMSCED